MTAPSPARFSAEDRAVLLAVKGVGPTVLERLETLGIASMEALACQGAMAAPRPAPARWEKIAR